ncbi:CoA ester lyase, partial [Azospirillum brasilense]|nr:CoA ester lyase [Azospirillum brasilense]
MPNNPQSAATAPESPVRRSYLFVPGARPDRFAKALGAGADAVIIDLEDAVAPGDKDSARAAVGAFLREHDGAGGPAVFVRTNSVRSRTGLLDILALTDLPDGAAPRWAGILLPKVDGAEDVRLAAGLLDERGLPGALGALIESANGLENAMARPAASPRRTSGGPGGGAL